jgi:hypothetical protein
VSRAGADEGSHSTEGGELWLPGSWALVPGALHRVARSVSTRGRRRQRRRGFDQRTEGVTHSDHRHPETIRRIVSISQVSVRASRASSRRPTWFARRCTAASPAEVSGPPALVAGVMGREWCLGGEDRGSIGLATSIRHGRNGLATHRALDLVNRARLRVCALVAARVTDVLGFGGHGAIVPLPEPPWVRGGPAPDLAPRLPLCTSRRSWIMVVQHQSSGLQGGC